MVMGRINIGNARLYGLEEDLGLKGNQFQTSVSILFVTYLVCYHPYPQSEGKRKCKTDNCCLQRLSKSRVTLYLKSSRPDDIVTRLTYGAYILGYS